MSAPAGLLTVRAYARHRGVSHTAVQAAIRKQRLSASVTREGKKVWIDAAVADQEWTANTDLTKAPTSVKARAAQRTPPARDRDEPDDDVGGDVVGGEPPMQEGMSLTDAARAEKYWTAMRKKLEYQARAGELVPAAEVRDRLVGLFTQIRTKLLGMPSKAKTAFPQLSNQDVAQLDRLVREACEDLATLNLETLR